MQHENSGGNSGDSNEKVFEILEKIYHSWTSVTHHYERRDKKDVKVLDHYLDHRTCAVCGYQWDVAVTETREKYTRKY